MFHFVYDVYGGGGDYTGKIDEAGQILIVDDFYWGVRHCTVNTIFQANRLNNPTRFSGTSTEDCTHTLTGCKHLNGG